MDQEDTAKKIYDLEERTFEFAKRTRNWVRKIPKNITNIEYGKQLIRSSGSVPANYIEACEALSHKDFYMRIKICRKEAKESALWIRLIEIETKEMIVEGKWLLNEARELTRIFGSIVAKRKNSD